MDKRDQELLDKQLHGLGVSSGSDGVTGLTVLAVFFAGLTIGGFLFAYTSEPMRVASNSFATSAISVPNRDDAIHAAIAGRAHLPDLRYARKLAGVAEPGARRASDVRPVRSLPCTFFG